MGHIVNLLARFTGVGAVLTKLNGAKSYISGAVLFLAGLIALLNEILAINDANGLLVLAKGFLSDPAIRQMAEGLGILGLRHAIAKKDAPSA